MYRYMIGALLSCVLLSHAPLQAQILYTGVLYTENFDTLASTGTSSTVPTGFAFVESGTSSKNDGVYTASDGNSSGNNAGDTFSLGATGNSDRAFGMGRRDNFSSIIGAQIQNSTGVTLTEILISYTGEQWRLGATGREDRLDFQFSTNATSLTTGTWTDFNALDFVAPVQAGTTGALDGNASANRTQLTAALTGLSVPVNGTFWIRWLDFEATGANDILGIDDFSIQPVPEPGTILGVSFAALGMVQLIRRKKRSTQLVVA